MKALTTTRTSFLNMFLVVLGATFLFSTPALVIRDGLAELADAGRRQAAAHCIDSWHAWVRGSHTNLEYPDIEYCMLLSGVEPPAGLEHTTTAANLERADADKRDRVEALERNRAVEAWWEKRRKALDYFNTMCESTLGPMCDVHRGALADEFPP